MSYPDADLLAAARQHAFEGLIEITALSDEIVETRRELRNHFSVGGIRLDTHALRRGCLTPKRDPDPRLTLLRCSRRRATR